MKLNLDNIPSKEIMKGFHAKMIHGENMTLAYWSIEKDAELPLHHHVHEQTVNMIKGKFQMKIGNEVHVFGPGDVFVIPSNTPHSGIALTHCRILDVFSPAREEYK